jgi:hypothetical protein
MVLLIKMKKNLFKNKSGAMEMSVGTIVTIVLLMAVLVLGLVLVQRIFKGSTENINVVDQKVKDQINKLFSEDDLKQVIIYPSTYIQLNKGKSAGFGLSIRNIEDTPGSFSYTIIAKETSCGMSLTSAGDLIAVGGSRDGITISPGSIMQDPIYVRFDIPENAPPCIVSYSVDVKKGTSNYGSTIPVDVEILSR